jgi:uroporphyrinogen-III synthase
VTIVLPLQNQRIVVTRSAEQADLLCEKLAALGAAVIRFPVIQFAPLPAPELGDALSQLEQYAWLLFTSGNAVRFFLERVENSFQFSVFSNQLRITHHAPRIAAVGSATQTLLAENNIPVDFVPDEFTGEQLVLGLGDVAGQRILLPRAKIGRQEIVEMLRERGAVVDDIPLYDTVTAVPDPAALAELEKGVDVITFTSPSSVRNFLQIIETRPQGFSKPLGSKIAVIGPSTATEAEKFGLTVDIMPR